MPMPEPHTPSELSLAAVKERDCVRLMLRGELDMNGVLDAERAVEAASELTSGRLVIDLLDLEFMDLFGARALLRAADGALARDVSVVIANPNQHVRRLFELVTDLAQGRSLVGELVAR